MLEALMLILLGILIAGLAALALAPLLWARAARVTTERVQQDVHSAAFSEASQHVSRRYEGEIAQREGVLRSEIEQLEASRDKISSEASSRVSVLEEVRAGLEQEIADRDARLAENKRLLESLADKVRSLGARADALGQEAADLGARAGTLSAEIADFGQADQQVAPSLSPADTTPQTPAPAENSPEASPPSEIYSLTEDEKADDPKLSEADEDEAKAVGITLSDRIRALREGVSA